MKSLLNLIHSYNFKNFTLKLLIKSSKESLPECNKAVSSAKNMDSSSESRA